MFLIKFINDPSKFIRIFNGYEESNQKDALKFDNYEDAFYEIAKVHMDETVPYHFNCYMFSILHQIDVNIYNALNIIFD